LRPINVGNSGPRSDHGIGGAIKLTHAVAHAKGLLESGLG